MYVRNAREQDKEGVKQIKKEKGKVQQIGPDVKEIMAAIPTISKKKRSYIKRDTDYWSQWKWKLIKRKQGTAPISAENVTI